MELFKTIKKFDYKDTRRGFKLQKKNDISDKSCKYTRASGAFSNKVPPDIDY